MSVVSTLWLLTCASYMPSRDLFPRRECLWPSITCSLALSLSSVGGSYFVFEASEMSSIWQSRFKLIMAFIFDSRLLSRLLICALGPVASMVYWLPMPSSASLFVLFVSMFSLNGSVFYKFCKWILKMFFASAIKLTTWVKSGGTGFFCFSRSPICDEMRLSYRFLEKFFWSFLLARVELLLSSGSLRLSDPSSYFCSVYYILCDILPIGEFSGESNLLP